MNKIHIIILAVLAMLVRPAQAQNTSQNYVKTAVYLKGVKPEDLKTVKPDSMVSVQYYNGLGYPTLSVATSATDGGTACTLTTYDALGRKVRKYVPVPGNGLDYISENGIMPKGYDFYQDNSCFTQNHYDALDRVTAVDIAGDKWVQAGKQDRTGYYANTDSDLVQHYEAPEDGTYRLITPEGTSKYYAGGTLSKVVTYDADDDSVIVFTDLSGNKVLERTAAGDTYYVWNVLGQLRFVLTPAYNKKSPSKTMFAYEYRYDSRGRMVMKILPKDSSTGSTTQYWYDRADRMAYMKDPALGSRYRFYLYDRFGRLCVQGTCSGGGQGHPILSATSQPASVLSTASYDSISAGLCNTGYTAPYAITDPQLEIVNYYDDYDFIGRNLTSAMPSVPVKDIQKTYSIGFQTGQVVFASNGGALGSISLYDQKGQVVRSVRKGLDGLLEDVSTAYSFTGAVDTMRADVNVRYGSHFIAESAYTYRYGKKTNMKLSVSHGQTPVSRNTKYVYDAIGRLVGKERKLLGTKYSSCVYSYDVHGWLTSVKNGSFQESLYYADGLDGGCYNGNISTVKWKSGSVGFYHGYNLKYDGCNRLYSAVFGTGDDLTGNKDYFNENVQYDCNGNITRLQRGGLVDNMRGWFGLVDDLTMTYEGNLLTSVRDDASHSVYASATDFDGVCGQEYPLMYNDAGSLMSDAGRKIARIDYDCLNNPVRIQFTNGNVTKYVYSATGEKLRVIYQTAVPNISVAIGCSKELVASEILYADSTDYLLGGSLTLKNGRIDKYQFEEGYCQAVSNASQDNFTFQYYDLDHLGNVRQVLKPDGSKTGKIVQTMDYYPFGAQLCDGTTDSNVQPRRYNGKELDRMHGLNTYDYGARQYNPIIARWDRVDPLCHKYYSITPYNYCFDNPVNNTDPDGKDPITGAVVGAVVELGAQLIENYDTDMSLMDNLSQNVNWTNVGIAAGEGALTSGVSALKGLGVKVALSAASSAMKEVSNQVKEGAKSYEDIDCQKVGRSAVAGAVTTAIVGTSAKVRTDAQFKGVKARPTNAVKHQRAGQKRYSKSAQHKANQKLRKQKEKYREEKETLYDACMKGIMSFFKRD